MISTRSGALVIDTVVCLTLAKWETVSGRFGGYLSSDETNRCRSRFPVAQWPRAGRKGRDHWRLTQRRRTGVLPRSILCETRFRFSVGQGHAEARLRRIVRGLGAAHSPVPHGLIAHPLVTGSSYGKADGNRHRCG